MEISRFSLLLSRLRANAIYKQTQPGMFNIVWKSNTFLMPSGIHQDIHIKHLLDAKVYFNNLVLGGWVTMGDTGCRPKICCQKSEEIKFPHFQF